MSSNRTIICFASGYDAPPTSKHHVMHLLAERHTVLWVNYHASRTPSATGSDLKYLLGKLGEVATGLRRRRRGLYTLTPLVLPLPGSAAARRINRMLLVAQIRRALAQIRTGPVEIWSFAPDIGYLVDALGPERLLYYCVDDHAAFSGYDAEQVRRDEIDLCRRADLVVTTSAALQRAREGDNPHTLCVPHGVDYEHFAAAAQGRATPPPELSDIPHPRLGFFGLIRDWVDLKLLAELARRRSEWQIVLLGDSTVDTAVLDQWPNIHRFGRRPYNELPGWCAGFDVGLIPFVVNELTHAVNPIKLHEYLAAALPVVSSPMPEVQACSAPVRIADGADAFEQAIEQALAEPPQARQALSEAMRRETWPVKLAAIESALDAAGKTRPAKPKRSAAPAKVMVTLCGGGFASYIRTILTGAPEQVESLLAAPEPMADWLASELPNAVAYRDGLRYRVCAVPEQRSRNHAGPIVTALRLMHGLIGCCRTVWREKPSAVVGVAASLSIPLLMAARLAGIRTVFVESLTRVRQASRTGRIISTLRLADRIYVQWPSARRLYPGARYEGRLA